MAKKRKKKVADEPGVRLVSANKRARHDYHIDESVEAGLVLRGSEVKSLRAGQGSLSDAYGVIEKGEAWLVNCHIPEYAWAHAQNHPPRRRRKLLLHRRELDRLETKLHERGFTLIPLRLYFRDAHVKVEMGLARGKKTYDKRESIKKRDQDRDARAELARRG